MKKNKLSHIRKWLLFYLSAVLFTTMALYLAIYIDVTGFLSDLELDLGADVALESERNLASIITGLELRLLLLLTVGLVICALIGWVWIGIATRRIGRPVRIIATAMTKLVKGQLNETVAVDTSDEFEQISNSINELAANLQELLLYIWKQTGQCNALLDHIYSNPQLRHNRRLTLESLSYLKRVAEAIDEMREMAKAYVFYDVIIEGTETHAINEPGDRSISTNLPSEFTHRPTIPGEDSR